MCFENIAKCEFCNFERHISWDRCPQWRHTYIEEYMGNLTGIFSDPPIPKPEDCPKRFLGVVIPIRPGSCPIGPPPAFVREERLRRRNYLRNFGYPDDSDDEDDDDDDDDAPFGIRGSFIHGCVGYEVRARLMFGQEWRDNWSHRHIRHRLGLKPCAPAEDRTMRPPKPIILLPIPASDLETLVEGEQPSEDRKVGLRDIVPRPEAISWTHDLRRPPYWRRGISDSESDGASVETDGSVAVDAGTAPSPVPMPISPQPQRRRRGDPVNGIRDTIDFNDLFISRMAEPKPRGRQRHRDAAPEPAKKDTEPVIEPGAVLFEGVPFQRPRSYSPRLYWGVPRDLMRRRYAEEEAAIIAKIKAEGGVPFEPTYEPEAPGLGVQEFARGMFCLSSLRFLPQFRQQRDTKRSLWRRYPVLVGRRYRDALAH